MDLADIRNVLAIERYGSITRAARELHVAQPNLSKSIKDLETEFGIVLFERSVKGVKVTMEGQRFIQLARQVQMPYDRLIEHYKADGQKGPSFRISIPRASYISYAYCNFVASLGTSEAMSLAVKETNSNEVVNNVVEKGYELGVVRYSVEHEAYYMALFQLKHLDCETILEDDFRVIASANGPLAGKERVTMEDLKNLIEISHGDIRLPDGSYLDSISVPRPTNQVFVYERGSQFELLCSVPDSYMWVSRMPQQTLSRMGLVERKVEGSSMRIRDVLIYEHNHQFGQYEKAFISELKRVVDQFTE